VRTPARAITVALPVYKKSNTDSIKTEICHIVVFFIWGLCKVWLLLSAHRHRNILGAVGHIPTPANQLMVMWLKIWSLSNPGTNQRPHFDRWPNCSNRARNAIQLPILRLRHCWNLSSQVRQSHCQGRSRQCALACLSWYFNRQILDLGTTKAWQDISALSVNV
jgi:hypothetical protein